MNSRVKKQPKSYKNYEQLIEKHLNDDFDVHEYLAQNNLTGDNMGDYSKLFNSMLVTKNQKRKKYDSLKVNYDQMLDQKVDVWTEAILLQMLSEKTSKFSQTYNQIAAEISFESKVQDAIHKQIIEIKKSINLLKGDIGHLVDRNESAKLLQSKICKVKIVADDQLKRVSLAYLKDKEEVKIRNDMQKNFNKKIKNATFHEQSSLNRLKKTYLDTMVKKKEIHDRLSNIQKVNASIHASEEKEKQMNCKRKRILSLFKYFNKLSNLIEEIRRAESGLLQISKDTGKFMDWFKTYAETQLFIQESQKQEQKQPEDPVKENSSLFLHYSDSSERFISDCIELSNLQNIAQTSLRHFESQIVTQFNRITQQIDSKTCQYNSAVKRREEIKGLLNIYQHQIDKLQMSLCKQACLQYIPTQQVQEEYSKKMKSFSSLIKTLFTFLEYIEKKLNYSNQFLNPLNHKKYSQIYSQFFVYRHSLSHMDKNASFETFKISPSQEALMTPKSQVLAETKHYSSQLYNIHCALVEDEKYDEKKLDELSLDIHNNLQSDIKIWINSFKEAIVYGIERLCPPKSDSHILKLLKLRNQARKKKDNRMSLSTNQNAFRQSLQSEVNQVLEENEFHNETYRKHHTTHPSSDDLSSRGYNIPAKSNSVKVYHSVGQNFAGNKKNLVNLSKLNNQNETQQNIEQAHRIQLIQNVDMDYYKMLKSTLKMEKENTRKNYMFLKNFKRSKYSSRDSILQQKRYEVSFSILFAGKKTQLAEKKNQDEKKNLKSRFVSRKSQFSKAASLQGFVSKCYEPSKIIQSTKDIKLPGLTQSENSMKQLRENFRRLKPNNSMHGVQKRSRLSGDFKEILNLVV